MAWTWRYEAGGSEVDPPEAPAQEPQPSQADAETWMGENWRELLAAGVTHVVLHDGETDHYRMGLDAPT